VLVTNEVVAVNNVDTLIIVSANCPLNHLLNAKSASLKVLPSAASPIIALVCGSITETNLVASTQLFTNVATA